jgi:hypothetical protein
VRLISSTGHGCSTSKAAERRERYFAENASQSIKEVRFRLLLCQSFQSNISITASRNAPIFLGPYTLLLLPFHSKKKKGDIGLITLGRPCPLHYFHVSQGYHVLVLTTYHHELVRELVR